METKQWLNSINTNNNIDTPNLNELTDNTTLDMHERTSNTIHTHQQNPFISNTNDSHTHSDNNAVHSNTTPQQNTLHNPPPPQTCTVNMTSSTCHLTFFKIIYALKLKLNKLQTNLTQLQEHCPLN